MAQQLGKPATCSRVKTTVAGVRVIA